MKKVTKLILISASVLVVVGVVGAVLVAGLGSALLDEPPPDDADLRPIRLEIPEQENAIHYFNLAGEKVYWPEEKEERIWDMLENEAKWDAAFVEVLIDKNRKTFAYLKRGLDCTQSQFSEFTSTDTLLPTLSTYRNMARLGCLHASLLMRSGRQKEALAQALDVVRFGHVLEASRGTPIHWLVGASVKGIGLGRLMDMLRGVNLDERTLADYARALDNLRPENEALLDALRREYLNCVGTIDDMSAGKLDLDYVMPLEAAYLGKVKINRWTLRPNRTKRMLAELFRKLMGNVPRYAAEWAEIQLPCDEILEPGWFNRSNVVGKMTTGLIRGLERLLEQKCVMDAMVKATQLLIALKCHKLRTGSLPDSLEELVPEYFEEVPKDPFDGKPMRYSRGKKIIYSVGTDLQDKGGDLTDIFTHEEPTFKIPF